jgi:hypothetical protein
MGERIHKVEVKIDGERFLDLVNVETMIALETGEKSFTSMAGIVKHFIFKDGAYMDSDEAISVIKSWSIRQLTDTVKSLTEAATDGAVNPQNGQESG